MTGDKALFNLIFLGAPGAGKGTQASRIADRLGLEHISTGDMIRAEIHSESVIGKELEETVNGGGFPSDDLVLSMLKSRLESLGKEESGVLLDGVPRTLYQAKALEAIFDPIGIPLLSVCLLEISDKEAVQRLAGRFSCAECGQGYHQLFAKPKEEGVCNVCGSTNFKRRADDSEEVAKNRLSVYHEQTAPLVNFYEKRGLLKRANAAQPVELVTQELLEILDLRSNQLSRVYRG